MGVTATTIRGVRVIALSGDVDLAAVPDVQPHLDAAVAAPQPRVVIDMARVTFADSSFLHCLIRAARAARQANGDMAIVCVDPAICRLLEVFGIAGDVAVHEELGTAIRALGAQT